MAVLPQQGPVLLAAIQYIQELKARAGGAPPEATVAVQPLGPAVPPAAAPWPTAGTLDVGAGSSGRGAGGGASGSPGGHPRAGDGALGGATANHNPGVRAPLPLTVRPPHTATLALLSCAQARLFRAVVVCVVALGVACGPSLRCG